MKTSLLGDVQAYCLEKLVSEGCWHAGSKWTHVSISQTRRVMESLRKSGMAKKTIEGYVITDKGREALDELATNGQPAKLT